MGTVSRSLATQLRDALGLERGIETGTFAGDGSRILAEVFPSAATIEWSAEVHASAQQRLARFEFTNLRLIQGDSRRELGPLAGEGKPTLYFLDGHWSGGNTAGAEDECPVLEEVEAISPGHPDDCIVIDDARLFTASPAPPHDPAQWPTLLELIDALRAGRPEHSITVLHDQVIAVPMRAKPIIDAYGRGPEPKPERWPDPPLERPRNAKQTAGRALLIARRLATRARDAAAERRAQA